MNFEDTCKGFLEVGKVSFACSKAFSFLVVFLFASSHDSAPTCH